MRKFKAAAPGNRYSILTLDDDPIITTTIQSYFERSGYKVDVENNPLEAIERVRTGSYDILLLDFLMSPLCGDQVVEKIREFNKDISIIMLTGHKDMAPPLETLRSLDIQNYYEKNDRFDQLELMVEACAKSIDKMRTIRGYRNGLSSMLQSVPSLYQAEDYDKIAEEALNMIPSFIDIRGAVAALKYPAGDGLSWAIQTQGAGICAGADDAEMMLSRIKQGIPGIDGNSIGTALESSYGIEGFLSVWMDSEPKEDDAQLLRVFGRQLASAADTARQQSLLEEKNSELDKAYRNLGKNYTEVIATVRKIVDAKDVYTRNHSDRVSFYAVELAKSIGKDTSYCERLRIAGLFHDIGKLGVPDRILLSKTKLTPEEYREIKTHSERGSELLSGLTAFNDIVPWVRAHHERFDGKGYPDCLAGGRIPEQARLIAVADAFDAMTSDRGYRNALGLETALKELELGKGTQFDPAFADAFIKLIRSTDIFEQATSAVYDHDPVTFTEV